MTECANCKHVGDPFSLFNIITSGYWPSSPGNLSCLISEEVFQLWDAFRKRMPGSSETSFLKSLNDQTILHGRVSMFLKQKYFLSKTLGKSWA